MAEKVVLPRVQIESPFSAPTLEGTIIRAAYTQMAIHHSLTLHESPFASHWMYPPVLNDNLPEERKLGMEAGFARYIESDRIALYLDLGMSGGMRAGLEVASQYNIPVVERRLYDATLTLEEIEERIRADAIRPLGALAGVYGWIHE
jgi:hypothetical protein